MPVDDFKKWEGIIELKKWLSGVKQSSRNQYLDGMTKYQGFTGLGAEALIDEIEEDRKKSRREQGGPEERLKDFYNWLVKEYKTRRGTNKGKIGIAPFKAQRLVGYIKTFYTKNGFIVNYRSPSASPRKENFRMELSPQDVKKMLDIAPTLRDKALILCGYQGGFDVDTVCKLNYGDVSRDLDKETPIILHVVREKEGINYHTCLGRDSVEALKLYLDERKRKGHVLEYGTPLFAKEGAKKLTNQRTTKHLTQIMMRDVALVAGIVTKDQLEKADINPAGYHALRSSFSRRLEYAGMPLNYIDYMQGHALAYNGAYSRPNPRKLREKYAEFESHLSISELAAPAGEVAKKLQLELEKRDMVIHGLEKRIMAVEKIRNEFMPVEVEIETLKRQTELFKKTMGKMEGMEKELAALKAKG